MSGETPPKKRSKVRRWTRTAMKWGFLGSLLVVRDTVRTAGDMGKTVSGDLRRATPSLQEAKAAWNEQSGDPSERFAALAARYGLDDARIEQQAGRYRLARWLSFGFVVAAVLLVWRNVPLGLSMAALGILGMVGSAYRERILRERRLLSFRDWIKGAVEWESGTK